MSTTNLSKRARERKHEEEKAKRALSTGTYAKSLNIGGSAEDAALAALRAADEKEAIELQWFKLLRNSDRMNQIASILAELAPTKVFDPRDIYGQHLKEESGAASSKAAAQAVEDRKDKGGKGQDKKLSKKDLIIAQNAARLHKAAASRDEEKLATLRSKARTEVKLETESGKLLLLLEILKTAVRDQNTIDALDTVWEIEEVVRDLGEDREDVRSALKKHSDVLQLARNLRVDRTALNKLNLVDFQLSEMSDRLPPLNLHALAGKFKLDPWQIRVLNLIEQRKSVLVTAPTSSGKTVLSTYVCSVGASVLFVVPTEPLAWQVAAMLRAMSLGIALVVPTLQYVPSKWDVVVGTPHALETALTKKIGFDFDYAIFDEVHSLNGRDGEALQRLISAMPSDSCRFVALSATIGNGPELARWWGAMMNKDGQDISLVEHQSRFINLQRHVWCPASPNGASDSKGKYPLGGDDDWLRQLHPLACITPAFLAESGFGHTDMALTPVDAYKLWLALDKHVSKAEDCADFDVSYLKPRKYFSDQVTDRVTLAKAHEYEKALKKRLEELAKQKPAACARVLSALASGERIKRSKSKKPTAEEGAPATPTGDAEDAGQDIISSMLTLSATANTPSSLVDLAFHLHRKKFTPCIAFQLDSVRCQTLFDLMLREIERREEEAYPDYRTGLLKQRRGLEKQEKRSNKATGAKRVDEDGDAANDPSLAQDFGELSAGAVDVDAPHPEFNLAPPGKSIGLSEATDIHSRLRDDLKSTGDVPHPLIRALRRGVGVYVEGLPSAYHRVVQSLAQRGALGVVFSDELLAYGVNMPFRTAVFYGDPGSHWLTPLLHQQMAGRAGRRGLDRQGHLVYAGFTPDRLRELMKGELPDVVGKFPLYPTIPLQLEMNVRFDVAGKPLDVEKMKVICRTPLQEFLEGKVVENYYEESEAWIERLGVLDQPPTAYSHLIPELIWDLRQFLPESVALEYMLESIIKKYRNAEIVKADKDSAAQFELALLFSSICSREPMITDPSVWGPNGPPSWYKPLPSLPDEWRDLLEESQSRIRNVEPKEQFPHAYQLLLPVQTPDGATEPPPLDNMCYAAFTRNQIDFTLPTPMQHRLRERLFEVGEVARIISQVFGKSKELAPVQNIVRKVFSRVRYILDETFERNWT